MSSIISLSLKRCGRATIRTSLSTHLKNAWSIQQNEAFCFSSVAKPNFDEIVKKNKVVVFMKGVPDSPKCGFSNAVVQILRMHGVENYDSHNVLENEDIRQGIFSL